MFFFRLKRLCHSGNLEQIDNERSLWFTNMDVDTRPKISVQGLWIFKFVQRKFIVMTKCLSVENAFFFSIAPWTILLSKSRQVKYFHNYARRESIPEAPGDSSHVASLR